MENTVKNNAFLELGVSGILQQILHQVFYTG